MALATQAGADIPVPDASFAEEAKVSTPRPCRVSTAVTRGLR
jgi:hypothetical protein